MKELFELNKADVSLKETSNPNLFVLKYKRHVFYKNTWNDFLRQCRGLVIDKEFNIVSLPFKKIHNYGIESDAPEFDDNEFVHASRKVNGFMIAVTYYNGDILWSTTGSLDSMYIDYAKEIFNSWSTEEQNKFKDILKLHSESTFMFECVHKNDPHIVFEYPGLYFIGLRHKSFDADPSLGSSRYEHFFWEGTPVKITETWCILFKELKEMAKTAKHEGFVFESMNRDYRCSKIKSPFYLSKKLLMRGNWENFLNRQTKSKLDEEFYPLYDYIHEVEREHFFMLDEIARREFIENWFERQQ